MRIAQVAPLFESVPPKLYGGTERVVYNLAEGLTDMGHDVTLFASGDSLTSAKLIPSCRKALRLTSVREPLPPHLLMFEQVRALAEDFDVVHFHNEYMHFPLARSINTPSISTMHGRLDLPEYKDFFAEFSDLPLVSISMNQRKPLPQQNWAGMVHHGMNKDLLKFNSRGGDYLAFLGRISPEKGVERAVEIATRVGMTLKIAAKVDNADKEYYQSIRHLIEQPGIEFIGEIGDAEKSAFIGNAKALLFPINWPEPFGLVMIESLACGTPVIAFRHGSVPEVIVNGETGYIVTGTDEACKRLMEIDKIDRWACRRDFEERFSVERMVSDYVTIYEQVIESFNRISTMSFKKLRQHSRVNLSAGSYI